MNRTDLGGAMYFSIALRGTDGEGSGGVDGGSSS